jgi:hypothetical protein
MSVTKQVYVLPRVGKDVEGVAFSVNYGKDGSACLNGPQWSYDQYGRGPVSFNSLPDTCPGSTTFIVHRLASEQEARPEYFARYNAQGIMGYGTTESIYDTQFGQQAQNRGYQLGLVNTNNMPQDKIANQIEASNATPYQNLGSNVPVITGPSF